MRSVALFAGLAALVVLPHCASPADEEVVDDQSGFATVKAEDTEPVEPIEDDPSLSDPGSSACDGKARACAPAAIEEDQGLRRIDTCSFHLGDTESWTAKSALVDRLAKTLDVVTVGDVLADANRDAHEIRRLYKVDDLKQGFRWQLDDLASTKWWPQGITGTGDASPTGMVDGRRALAVTFYDKNEGEENRGVRVAFADISNPSDVKYRFALLVDVKDAGGRTDLEPVRVHAGGAVWYGNYLYIPSTGSGFKVFDMTRILRTPDTGANIGFDAATNRYSAADYRYVIPQVGEYKLSSSCPVHFSFAALDRSTTPHSIVTGEYDFKNVGRLLRWSLDEKTGRLQAPYYPVEAYYSQQSRVQGAVSWKGKWWVMSAAQTLMDGKLYRVAEGQKSQGFGRPPGVEDLYHDPTTGLLWSLTEFPGLRYVFATPIDEL